MTTLLLVEDNVLLATTIERFLRDRGNVDATIVVPTAELALERLQEHLVDLLLVDVSLPGMSGIDLVATLSVQYPQLPCLILSGHTEADYVQRALAAGAKGYVIKSEPQTILTAVQRVLAGESYLSDEARKKLPH
jgi:DNA-binding NarL/FixJ family response regulator